MKTNLESQDDLDYLEVCTKGFTPEELQDELELRRKEVIKELIDINYKEKHLKYQKLEMVKLLADQEKIKQLYELIIRLHEGILETDAKLKLDEVVQQVLSDKEDLDFFSANKHSTFNRSREVLDLHNDHPVQKKMLSTKSMSVKGFNTTNTYNKHIAYLHNAKQILELKEKVSALEEANTVNEVKESLDISAISNAIDSLAQRVSNTEDVVKGIIDELSKLTALGVDPKKLLVYKTKMDNPSLTHRELAKMFNVGIRTIFRWMEQMKTLVEKGDVSISSISK